mgnify:CR=1 FL=1
MPLLRAGGSCRSAFEGVNRSQGYLSLAKVVDRFSQDPRRFLRRVEAVRVFRFDEVDVKLPVTLELEGRFHLRV